jgi:arylsulfatase A-like enzyme
VYRKEAKKWGNKPSDIYDSEINYTDIYLGKLFDFLKEKKILDDFIVIITADHGDAFGLHGYYKHGRSVYNDQMWVPLIIRFPDVEPRIIEHEVSHLDIIPTVLDYLGITKYENKFSGMSIFKKIKENNFPPIYTLLFKPRKSQYSIIKNGYKLNYFAKQDLKKLFDIRRDMKELNDISNEHPEILYDMWENLSKWINKEGKTYNLRNR